MAFTVSEFRELLELLEQQPTWRAELRRWVLTEELLALPQTVHALAEAQRRTEERLGQMAGHMDTLTQRMEQFTVRMEQLAATQLRMGSDLEQLKGSDLERRYRERAHAYFSRLLRRTHVLSGDELSRRLDDAVLRGQFTEAEADAVLQADMVVRGRHREDGTEVYLVVEVSWGIGLSDVQRASERAALLARTGIRTLPVVAGVWVMPEAQEPARALQVWQVTDGHVVPPEPAQHS
jgi:DNA-binding transcriptional MerR regulator